MTVHVSDRFSAVPSAVLAGGQDRRLWRSRCFGAGGGIAWRAALVSLVAAVLAMLVVPSPAGATFLGRNGVLLASSWSTTSPFTPIVADPSGCDPPLYLWTVRPDGSHSARPGHGNAGLFSPQGFRLAIQYFGDPAYYEGCGPRGRDPSAGLYLSRADGSQRRRISGDGIEGWLPGGRLVVWQRRAGKVRLFDPLSGHVIMTVPDWTMPEDTGFRSFPSAMSCRARVAIRRGHSINVFTPTAVRVNGTVQMRTVEQRVVTSPYVFALHLAWSPDGRWLLFGRLDRRGFGLWRVGPAGRGLRRLTTPAESPVDVGVWSPDGRRIVYLRKTGPGVEAVVMNADGSHKTVLGGVPVLGGVQDAVWSPDAKTVAFGGVPTIWLVNAQTGAHTTIPFTNGNGLLDWQALPDGHSIRCADRASTPTTPTSTPTTPTPSGGLG
jgi:WD40 repeat protein